MNGRLTKTKQQLIDASKALFVKFGFDKISMDDIAQASHKAKRSIYNHFANKEDIFTSMMESEFDKLQSSLSSVFEPEITAPLDQLQTYLLRRFELIKASGIWKLVAAEHVLANRFDSVKNHIQQFEKWEHDQFVAVWKSMAIIPDPEIVHQHATAFADMLQMVLKGLDYTMFVQDKYDQYKETYNFLINMIINSVKFGVQDFFNKKEINK